MKSLFHKLALLIFSVAMTATSSAAVFVPDDRRVSDVNTDIIDPEFDPVENLMVWRGDDGTLWLADIDPDTGAILPDTGQGIAVDSNLPGTVAVGNGPEFGYGAQGVFIGYTKEINENWFLAVAAKNAMGVWGQQRQQQVVNRWRPIGSLPGTTDPARMTYIHEISPGVRAVSWREVSNAASEGTFTNIGGVGGRWAGSERAFASTTLVDGIPQVFYVNIDTEEVTQITFDTDQKYNIFLWEAPDFGGDMLMSAAINFTDIGIYRRSEGVWSRIYTFQLPSRFDYIASPEPFVHNGKSYITAVSAVRLGVGPLAYVPAGPSEIWIANIDQDKPFFRRIDEGTLGVRRSEPETFTLSTGPVVYYTESDQASGNALVRVADTGLGSVAAGDSDGDGVSDDRDNCVFIDNPDQRDSDQDGIGNFCDPDLNNDCIVDGPDYGIINFLTGTTTPVADLNNDGIVDIQDVLIWVDFLFMAPGPGSPPTLCDPA